MANVDPKPPGQIRYERVRGLWRAGTLSTSQLFTGGDHLLLCDYRSGFTERYRRFYFNDIQAIIIRRTAHWLAGSAIWGFIGLCFLIIALSTHWNLFLEIMVGICGLFALRHLIRGPSCRTTIQTAVQTDMLPMLKRVRKTNRILGRLFPLIEQAQGRLGENGTVALATTSPPPVSSTIGDSKPIAPPSVSKTSIVIRHDLSWLHVITFGLVLLSGLNAIWEVNYPSTTSFAMLIGLFGASVVGGIVALVRQAKHRVHRWAAATIWMLVISFILGGGGIDYAFTMIALVTRTKNGPNSQPPPLMMDFVSPFEMRHMAGFDPVLWTYGGWAILLALLGLMFVLLPAPVKVVPPPMPGETSR